MAAVPNSDEIQVLETAMMKLWGRPYDSSGYAFATHYEFCEFFRCLCTFLMFAPHDDAEKIISLFFELIFIANNKREEFTTKNPDDIPIEALFVAVPLALRIYVELQLARDSYMLRFQIVKFGRLFSRTHCEKMDTTDDKVASILNEIDQYANELRLK